MRSILGALLWLTATRLDIISDLSVFQSRVTVAEIKDLKAANEILLKVNEFIDVGLHYRFMEDKHIRLACIHDASSSSKGRYYAQEGILIGLMADKFYGAIREPETVFHNGEGPQGVGQHAGVFHVLHAQWIESQKDQLLDLTCRDTQHGWWHGSKHDDHGANFRIAPSCTTTFSPTIDWSAGTWRPTTTNGLLQRLQRPLGIGDRPENASSRQVAETLCPRLKRSSDLWADAVHNHHSNRKHDCWCTHQAHDPRLSIASTYHSGIIKFFNVPGHPVTSRTFPSILDFDEHDLGQPDNKLIQEVRQGQKQVRIGRNYILAYYLWLWCAEREWQDGHW